MADGTLNFSLSQLDEMIAAHDSQALEEEKYLDRFEKESRRDDRSLKGAHKATILAAHEKLRRAGRGMFDEGRDFVLFLRAVRAELDGERRGGDLTTSNPKELRALLTTT